MKTFTIINNKTNNLVDSFADLYSSIVRFIFLLFTAPIKNIQEYDIVVTIVYACSTLTHKHTQITQKTRAIEEK